MARSIISVACFTIWISGVLLAFAGCGDGPKTTLPTPEVEFTLEGTMVCDGACMPDPKATDHVMVLYAIGGPPHIRNEVKAIVDEFCPAKGLDAPAAQKLMDQFSSRLKYYISPDSPARPEARQNNANHYCQPAQAVAITGSLFQKDGRKWIRARTIRPAKLQYPSNMLAADIPFVKPARPTVELKIASALSLRCVYVPPGKFLMGTPFYMWPYFQEEYPHPVTLTKGFYLSEIPITQEIYEAVMGSNPSTIRGPNLPVQDPTFADIDKFCKLLSQRTGRTIRLPTDAQWEYAARVGTSNPGFGLKYRDQNSGGTNGSKAPLPVKSRQPNAWGLYDMASCWWEITADRGMYNVRIAQTDPSYPPPAGADPAKVQRSGRGIVNENWSIGTHEFITEKGYAGQKFRIVVEDVRP